MGSVRGVLSACAGIAAVALGVAVPAWACYAPPPEPAISLAPDKGPAGSAVEVRGTHWAHDQTVTLSWNANDQLLGTATTDTEGRFSTGIVVPAGAPPSPSSPYSVRATQGAFSAFALFFVDAPPPSTSTSTTTAPPAPTPGTEGSPSTLPAAPTESPGSNAGRSTPLPDQPSTTVAVLGASRSAATTPRARTIAAATGGTGVSSTVPAGAALSGSAAAEVEGVGTDQQLPAAEGSPTTTAAGTEVAHGESTDASSSSPLGPAALSVVAVGAAVAGTGFVRRRRIPPPPPE